MEDGRFSHNWVMCVVSHGCGGLDGAGIEVVLVGKLAGQRQGVCRMLGDAEAFPECEVHTLITPDRTIIQVRSSGSGRIGIGWFSWKGLSTGRQTKPPVSCPCSWLAALRCAQLTQV